MGLRVWGLGCRIRVVGFRGTWDCIVAVGACSWQICKRNEAGVHILDSGSLTFSSS